MMTPLEQAHYLTGMIAQGYTSVRPVRNQEYWVGLCKYVYTTAIVIGQMGDEIGYDNRWCYHNRDDAQKALDNWDGNGEPDGWHRNPISGRRRQNGFEYIDF